MKRLAASTVCLIIVMLFVSCGKSYDYGADEGIVKKISEACETVAKSTGYKGSFVLNMLFSEEDATLMFAQGYYDTDFTGEMPYVTASMTQTVLATHSGVQVNYENGICTTTTDGTPASTEMTSDEFFGRIIYVRPFVPDTKYIEGIDEISSASVKGFKVYLNDAEDVLYPLIGDGIYSLAMIRSPQYDLMNIKDAEISYIINENSGEITDMTFSFTLYIYDTPTYVPNGKDENLDDYTLDIRITYTVAF